MRRKFKLVMSGRLHRFDAKAVAEEAAEYPGCYELVVLDRERKPSVAFVGVAMESIRASLEEHLRGAALPGREELGALSLGGEVFYEFVSGSDIDCKEEHLDIAAALVARHRPPFNPGPPPSTGKFDEVDFEEAELPR